VGNAPNPFKSWFSLLKCVSPTDIIFHGGYKALFRDRSRVEVGRGTTDQYGIRMVINVDGEPIKTEIIAEARFELDLPRYREWSSVACLSLNDRFTAKLMANSDRFMDDSVEARDLIDLAILRLQSLIPSEAMRKAEKAIEAERAIHIIISSSDIAINVVRYANAPH
jgi:Nucleotidyl transferase AbiEii toxin, Type IV TA system